MKQALTVGAALLLTTSMAQAGGLDRSGQGIGVLFEDGNTVELSFGSVRPSVSGSVALGPTTQQSGDMAPDYTQFGFGVKMQVNDQVSLALISDQPFGADVNYDTTPYPVVGSKAIIDSQGFTALVRYELDPIYSVHVGLRNVSAEGSVALVLPASYASTYSSASGSGYVAGVAYERDDIALRVALTYSSEIDLALDGTAGNLTTTLPESYNLDFQTGIAADTLLFGSVRWVGWNGFALTDSLAGDLVVYTDDVYTYNIGIGRRLSDQFSASVSIGHEASTGEVVSNLGPTDGYTSVQIGGAYDMGNGVEVSGGVRYVNIGDATTAIGSFSPKFTDNSAVAVGLKLAYNF
ncbi:MAG: transporter [Proteobacteria bacterium]|nr:transporter [Pseudomonadota bacterium]